MKVVIPKREIHMIRSSDLYSYKIEALGKKGDRLLKEAHKNGDVAVMNRVNGLNKCIKKLRFTL